MELAVHTHSQQAAGIHSQAAAAAAAAGSHARPAAGKQAAAAGDMQVVAAGMQVAAAAADMQVAAAGMQAVAADMWVAAGTQVALVVHEHARAHAPAAPADDSQPFQVDEPSVVWPACKQEDPANRIVVGHGPWLLGMVAAAACTARLMLAVAAGRLALLGHICVDQEVQARQVGLAIH